MKAGGNENLSFAEQDTVVMKWSILWRTLILSALGKTFYPYCRHLRDLDLRDLSDLLDRLDEGKYKTKVAKHFFAGDLERFHHTYQTKGKYRTTRLDVKSILVEVGDLLTQQAPMLEGVSEPMASEVIGLALPAWAPRLEHLLELELWDGKALEDETLGNLVHAHCHKLQKLRIHHSSGMNSDHYLANFINGMPPNTLVSFENMSSCRIATECCLAFNTHGRSLTTLKLALEEDGILALALLQNCTTIESLNIASLIPNSTDLKATQNEAYLEIWEWLKRCDNLNHVSFQDVISAPDLLMPVLLNSKVQLSSLHVGAKEGALYQLNRHHDFHRALTQQPTLDTLSLRADPDPVTRDDQETVLDALCSLVNLRDLNLFRVSDYFSDQHVKALAQRLKNLESLYIGGYGVSDAVLDDLAGLPNLKMVNFAGITAFSVRGILDFINKLGRGNAGLAFSVEMADPDSMISEDDQEHLRKALYEKVGGRFDYQPLRGESTSIHGCHVVE